MDSGTGQSPGSVTGNIYAGTNLTLDGPSSGGALTVTGNAQAAGTITKSSSVTLTGSSTPTYSTEVTWPTVSMSTYLATAQANDSASNDSYRSGNVTFASGGMPATITGNVLYINGDVTIQGTQSTRVCLVATGNITMSKSGSTYPKVTITAPTNYPAIVCTKNLTYSSNGNGGSYLRATGLVYPQGNFTWSSANHDELTLTGSLMARGTITISPTAQNAVAITKASVSNLTGLTDDNGAIAFQVLSINS